jgi:hypothetical protein
LQILENPLKKQCIKQKQTKGEGKKGLKITKILSMVECTIQRKVERHHMP